MATKIYFNKDTLQICAVEVAGVDQNHGSFYQDEPYAMIEIDKDIPSMKEITLEKSGAKLFVRGNYITMATWEFDNIFEVPQQNASESTALQTVVG